MAPLTLGMSEAIFGMEYQDEQQRRTYARYYAGLSAEQQAREDRRDAARLRSLGMALSGGGPFRAPQAILAPAMLAPLAPARLYPRAQSCVTYPIGTMSALECY
jgi:hypothetical protein